MTEPSSGAPALRCPVCASEIASDATRCERCGAPLPSAPGTFFFDFGKVTAGREPAAAQNDAFAEYAARASGIRRAAMRPAWDDEDFARISKSAGSPAGEVDDNAAGRAASPAPPSEMSDPMPDAGFVRRDMEPESAMPPPHPPVDRPPSSWTLWRARRRLRRERALRGRRERRELRRHARQEAAARLREKKEAVSRRRGEEKEARRLARAAAVERRRERLAAGRRRRSEAAGRLRRQQQEGRERRHLEREAAFVRRREARRIAAAERGARRRRAAALRRDAMLRISRAMSDSLRRMSRTGAASLAGLAGGLANGGANAAMQAVAGVAAMRHLAAPLPGRLRAGVSVLALNLRRIWPTPRLSFGAMSAALVLFGGLLVYEGIAGREPGEAALSSAEAPLPGPGAESSVPADAVSPETVPSMPPSTETRLASEQPVPLPLPRIRHRSAAAKIAANDRLPAIQKSRDAGEAYTRSMLLPAAEMRNGGRRRLEMRIADVQTRLRNLGYPAGPSTGIFNTDTQRAILLYQIDSDLPRTGEIDARLLRRLRTEGDGEWQTATDWAAPRH